MVAQHPQTPPSEPPTAQDPLSVSAAQAADFPAAATPTPTQTPPFPSWAWLRARVAPYRTLAGLRAATETALIVFGLVAQFFWLPHFIINYGADGQIRFQMMNTLLGQGRLDGSRYSIYGPIFSTPLWYLGRVVATTEYWLGRYNLLLLALAVAAFYWLLRNRLDRGILRTFLLLLVVASMFPNHIENYYGEVFTALTVAVGLTLVVFHRRWGWVLIVLGVANATATIAGLFCVTVRHLLRYRRVRVALAGVVVVVLIGAESWVRRSSPLKTGYEGDGGSQTLMPFFGHSGFSYPFLFGALSVLLSFGKGIFFYIPGILLPVKRRLLALRSGATAQLLELHGYWVWFLVGLVLIYAQWWAWYGGWFWGPRFFLIASIPASFALAVWLHSREQSLLANVVTLAVLLLTVWVGLDGAIFGQNDLSPVCRANGYRLETFCLYTPDFSALFHPFSLYFQFGLSPTFAAKEQLTDNAYLYAGYTAVVLLYLATPLVWRMLRQVSAQARALSQVYLQPGVWRF